jgi:protein TonB
MPELATIAALPDIPEIPAQVIRKVANRVASPSSNKTNSEKKPTSTNNSNTAPSTATNLTFGNGAGRQPSPQYPYQARRANQQGTVVIEFIVGMDGRVLSAWVKSPCAWPLLNNSALSTVRSSWKFPSGSPRRYRIPIVFRLS